MVGSKHIRRNFNMSAHRNIHYSSDYWLAEITRFDRKYLGKYYYETNNITKSSNCTIKKWKPWSSFQSKDKKIFTLTFSYNCPYEGDYRIETLYSNLNINDYNKNKMNANKKLNMSYTIDNKKVDNQHEWFTYSQYDGLNIIEKHFTEGEHTFTLSCDPMAVILGIIIKPYAIYKGDNLNQEYLTIKDFDFKQANDFSVDELNLNLQYWHELDCDDSRSGFIFDYRDEINFYISPTVQASDIFVTPIDKTKKKQIFGGYISTVSVDDDLQKMSINCASRLTDLTDRYIYPEYILLGGNESVDSYKRGNSFYDLENYAQVIRQLLSHPQVPIKSNIKANGTIDDSKYTKSPRVLLGSGKGRKKVVSKSNVEVEYNANNVQLRNGTKTNVVQSVCLFKENSKKYDITNFPTFYITYGMDEPLSQTSLTKFESEHMALQGINVAKEIKAVVDLIKPRRGIKGAEDIFNWVIRHIQYDNYSRFQRKPVSILKHPKRGANCCDMARLNANLLYASGLLTDPEHKIKCYYINANGVKFRTRTLGHVYLQLKYQRADKSWTTCYMDTTSTRVKFGQKNGKGGHQVGKSEFPKLPF